MTTQTELPRGDSKHCCNCNLTSERYLTLRFVIIAFVICFIAWLIWGACHASQVVSA